MERKPIISDLFGETEHAPPPEPEVVIPRILRQAWPPGMTVEDRGGEHLLDDDIRQIEAFRSMSVEECDNAWREVFKDPEKGSGMWTQEDTTELTGSPGRSLFGFDLWITQVRWVNISKSIWLPWHAYKKHEREIAFKEILLAPMFRGHLYCQYCILDLDRWERFSIFTKDLN